MRLQISFFFFLEERKGKCHRRENIPSRQLVDDVSWKANAVKPPCARSHSNASKLDAVLAKQCFTQCSVATRDVLSPSVVRNAWICAPRATDRDLESVRMFL